LKWFYKLKFCQNLREPPEFDEDKSAKDPGTVNGLSNLSHPCTDNKAVRLMAWWESFIPMLDAMPDGKWSLINAPTKKFVYDMYVKDQQQKDSGLPEVSQSYFNKIWREQYGKIVRLRKFHRFSKCKTCLQLKGDRAREPHGSAQRRAIQAELLKHYAQIRAYRTRSPFPVRELM
jgi:hypothetical protein